MKVSLIGLVLGCAMGLTGCVDTPEPALPVAAFAIDAPTTWREVRTCRHSHEHLLRHIRVLADDLAHDIYLNWNAPYPVDATLLKLEYDDAACTVLMGYTLMKKLAKDADPARHNWLWQRVDLQRHVIDGGAVLPCVDCHVHHCKEADNTGFDLTCAEEI